MMKHWGPLTPFKKSPYEKSHDEQVLKEKSYKIYEKLLGCQIDISPPLALGDREQLQMEWLRLG